MNYNSIRQFGFCVGVLFFLTLPANAQTPKTNTVLTINSADEIASSLPVYIGKKQLMTDLKKFIHDYQKMTDADFAKIEAGPKLQKGEQGPRVLQLRQRLWMTKDFKNKSNLDNDLFDDELEVAVKSFQLRHGLNADGMAGVASIKLMNMSLADVVHKMQVNVQRFEDLEDDFGEHYIFVNIPDYRMQVIHNGERTLAMRVIVGSPKNKTPLFSDEMEYVVLSPKWNVPSSITTKEILPKLKNDPEYLAKRNYKIIPTKVAEDGTPFDPAQIDWNNVDVNNLNFRLVKDAGSENDLGYYKFIFPNVNNVYLHDTNSRRLFANDFRALSHGCVRISRPLDLAAYLLGEAGWTRETLEKTAKAGQEKFVTLKNKLPVHIRYFTAWVDETGRLNLRDDIYNYDNKVQIHAENETEAKTEVIAQP